MIHGSDIDISSFCIKSHLKNISKIKCKGHSIIKSKLLCRRWPPYSGKLQHEWPMQSIYGSLSFLSSFYPSELGSERLSWMLVQGLDTITANRPSALQYSTLPDFSAPITVSLAMPSRLLSSIYLHNIIKCMQAQALDELKKLWLKFFRNGSYQNRRTEHQMC